MKRRKYPDNGSEGANIFAVMAFPASGSMMLLGCRVNECIVIISVVVVFYPTDQRTCFYFVCLFFCFLFFLFVLKAIVICLCISQDNQTQELRSAP